MSTKQNDPQSRPVEIADETAAPRRPYEAPAVIESAVFETLALSCAKTSGLSTCLILGGFSAS